MGRGWLIIAQATALLPWLLRVPMVWFLKTVFVSVWFRSGVSYYYLLLVANGSEKKSKVIALEEKTKRSKILVERGKIMEKWWNWTRMNGAGFCYLFFCVLSGLSKLCQVESCRILKKITWIIHTHCFVRRGGCFRGRGYCTWSTL